MLITDVTKITALISVYTELLRHTYTYNLEFCSRVSNCFKIEIHCLKVT